MNETRQFPDGVDGILGYYVYGFFDPRDNKLFYVGQGRGNRLFQHFDEADRQDAQVTAKISRIREIWNEDLDVVWRILRYGLDQATALQVEAALIDGVGLSQNGSLLNEIAGHNGENHGLLEPDEVAELGAQSVNPQHAFPRVFVFPIHNQIGQQSIYDATRRAWRVAERFRNPDIAALAVGLTGGICRAVFEIHGWQQDQEYTNKWAFEGEQIGDHELENKNWISVIGYARGYWSRGNYLVVGFDGAGHVSFQRGRSEQGQLLPL